MKSCLTLLLIMGMIAVACQPDVTPPSPPPPSSPPQPTNHPPVAVAGGPYTSESGEVEFDGSQSSDPDGDPLTFKWTFGDGGNGTGKKVTHTYAQDGNYTVTLQVTDSHNAQSTAVTTSAMITRPSAVLAGAGNIASGGPNDERTATLLDQINGTVFTLGDNAFPDGSDAAYADHYASTWGRHLARTRPVLGNHDYEDADAKGSFDYFGDKLGPPGLGYYSYDVGAWHVIVLNDHGASGIDATQAQWLQADLAAHTNKCTLAMWHVPLFQSSNTPGWTLNLGHKPIWDALYAAGVDVVLNGQQHHYERLAPMNPSGALDPDRGIRSFNVGTGGESVENMTAAIHPNSEIRGSTFGVLKLTLRTNSYQWDFVPIPGASFSDTGTGTCH